METFTPAFGLGNPHLQTLWGPLWRKTTHLERERERLWLEDGDFLDLDWHGPHSVDAPLVLVLHGLTGSSNSPYVAGIQKALGARGWASVALNWRGCSGEPNRLPRAYHSGDSEEINWILQRLKHDCPQRPLYAAGVSLGGNVLLKWLGERGTEATRLLEGAAAVSAPVDLAACGHHLGRGFNRVYSRHFLSTLKPTAAAMLERFPGLFDARRLRAAATVYDFDDVVTGPVHGFAGAEDYWRRASSKPWLPAIALPTLMLNAQNDPFMPAQALPRADEVSAQVRLEFPREGGHVGFVSGSFPGKLDWLPQRLLHFFAHGE